MKIAVLNVGLIRPSVNRVIKNIIQNQDILSNKYPDYEFVHYNYYYPDSNLGEEFKKECKANNIKCKELPLAEEKTYSKDYVLFANTYKCWKNLENAYIDIPNISQYDAIIRTRLDFEIKNLDLPKTINNNNIYAQQLNIWSIFDNFSIVTPSTYKKLYNIEIVNKLFNMLKNKKVQFENNEQILQYICFIENIQCKDIKFNIHGYQSNVDVWNGSPQWSKRDRQFNFYNK